MRPAGWSRGFGKKEKAPLSQRCFTMVQDAQLTHGIQPDSREAQAGITCLACHSMATHPQPGGNGHFTLSLSPVTLGHGHSDRVRPAHLSDTGVCTTCHDVALDPSVTASEWTHGQDDGDAWYDSGYNGHGTHTPWPAASARCQECHMPRVQASPRERGAKDGWVRDHRFLGANSAPMSWMYSCVMLIARTI